MKISIPTTCRKQPTLLATLLAAAGCAPLVAEAPFPVRPDTVVPGDLAGPFEGRVVDAESGKPVDGASVLASWVFESGAGLTGPHAAPSRLVDTDSDGRYRIPRLVDYVDRRARLERFTLVIYKRGYVAYRSDRRFDDLSPRRDFAQTGNEVRLDRFGASASHTRHLRFVGAGGPLLAKLGWELQEAALETVEATPKEAEAGPALDGSVLLSPDELRAVTGFTGEFGVAKLEDRASDQHYDSVAFRGGGLGGARDASVRVFKLDAASAEKQYDVIGKEMSGLVEKNEVGDRSLRGKSEDVFLVAALDRARGVVVVFTCASGLCKDANTAVALVKRMWPRLGRLGQRPVEKEAP